jgi:hypothetical protein
VLTGDVLTGPELTGGELTGGELTGGELTGGELTGPELARPELAAWSAGGELTGKAAGAGGTLTGDELTAREPAEATGGVLIDGEAGPVAPAAAFRSGAAGAAAGWRDAKSAELYVRPAWSVGSGGRSPVSRPGPSTRARPLAAGLTGAALTGADPPGTADVPGRHPGDGAGEDGAGEDGAAEDCAAEDGAAEEGPAGDGPASGTGWVVAEPMTETLAAGSGPEAGRRGWSSRADCCSSIRPSHHRGRRRAGSGGEGVLRPYRATPAP